MPAIRSDAVPEDVAAVLSALGNPARARIVRELIGDPTGRTVPELATVVGVTRAAAHNHVLALEAVGAIRTATPADARQGRVVRWTVDVDGVGTAVGRLHAYLLGQ